jgi:hypothetical protein
LFVSQKKILKKKMIPMQVIYHGSGRKCNLGNKNVKEGKER